LFRFLLAALLIALAWGPASAQTDVPDTLKNRPPVAAPTSQIDVAPIEIVRSMSEVVNDFGGGLIQGLLASHGLRNAALVAVQENRIIATRDFGCCVSFSEVFYSDLLAPFAVMQLVERQRLKLEDRVANIVAGYGADEVTVGEVLTQQVDPAALRAIVEASSGQDFRSYVSQNILSSLTAAGGSQPESLAQVMGRLMVALLNAGTFEGGQFLTPETIELMGRTQFSIHPALPGWTYGFAEMRRNGWRALQRDGAWLTTPAIEARMVVVPEAKLAYFIIVEGRAGAAFWRVLDDALFDRILERRNSAVVEAPSAPAPDPAQARAVAGSYEASDEPLASAAPLKSASLRLVVRAAEDGSLRLSGSENAVLMPQPGGYWATEDGNLNAAANDGRLVLSSGLYRPLRWWRRPALYASLALVSAFGAAGAFYGERRGQRAAKPALAKLAPALLAAVAAFLSAALFAWHLLPAL
jgi:CubicO group peptidase (beta-lactamase class C family)